MGPLMDMGLTLLGGGRILLPSSHAFGEALTKLSDKAHSCEALEEDVEGDLVSSTTTGSNLWAKENSFPKYWDARWSKAKELRFQRSMTT